MADDNFISSSDPNIAAAMQGLIPTIEQKLEQAAGRGRRVGFMLFAGVVGDPTVSVAINNDDPRGVITAVLQWARFVEQTYAELEPKNRG